MHLTHSIKRIVFTGIYLLKVHELFRFFNRKKAAVIMYHGVVEKELNPLVWQMSVQRFEQQIKYISKKYNVLPLTTIVEKLINNEKLPDYSLAITFDDGFKNNCSTAFPILKRLNLPATIFLTTGNVGSTKLSWFDKLYLAIKETQQIKVDLQEDGLGIFPIATTDEKTQTLSTLLHHMKGLQKNEKDVLLGNVLSKLGTDSMKTDDTNPFKSLDWDDIISMQKSGLVSFGAHTETHNIMTKIPREEVLQEIQICKEKIEEKLKTKCLLFAYPNGLKDDFNEEIKDALKGCGFLCAFTTIDKFNEHHTDPFEFGRFTIGSDFDEQYFKLLISGALTSFKKGLTFLTKRQSDNFLTTSCRHGVTKPIRVMHLNAPVQIGGAEKVIMTLSNGMKGTAFSPIAASFVTYGEPHGEFSKEAKRLGIDTRIITTKKKRRFMASELIRNLIDLCHLLKEENISLLHTHGYKADIIGLIASKILNIPIVTTAHGWTACSKNVKLYEFLDRLALKFFNKVIAVSDSVRDRLLKSHISPQKIVKIYNATELKLQTPHSALRTPHSALNIGAIGRLSIEKGFNYFIEAGKEVISMYPQTRLLIVGDGPERQNLELLAERLAIKDKVIFCGFQKDTSKIYSMLDVVVLSSITEGLPIILLEALAYEKPVAATRVGGVPELIKDGETGILVNPKDSHALANGILKILDNPEGARDMAIRGKKLVEEKFNIKSMNKSIEKLYHEVLNSKCAV